MIYICSDWHLLHNKDFIYKPRGYTSAEEMTEDIIKRHNEIVKPDDIVYVLGDCVVGGPPAQEHIELLKQFNGKKYLAFGNHDTDRKLGTYANANIFEDIKMGYRMNYKHISFILTHYPTHVSNYEDPKPVWCIHGHNHSDAKFGEIPKCYNVCMEATHNYPVALDSIVADIKAFSHKNKN